jgi:hypothetical protein
MSAQYHPFIGSLYREHTVPPGMITQELKTCENCSRLFVRPLAERRAIEVKNLFYAQYEDNVKVLFKDSGERFCGDCKRRLLQPPAIDEYRAQFPRCGKDSVHLPHYDNSISPVKVKVIVKRGPKNLWLRGWQVLLLDAFEKDGPLSARQIAKIVGSIHSIPSLVVQRVRAEALDLKIVGSVWPRHHKGRGPSARLYLPTLYV